MQKLCKCEHHKKKKNQNYLPELLRRKKEARAEKKAVTIEMIDTQIDKLNLHLITINHMYL